MTWAPSAEVVTQDKRGDVLGCWLSRPDCVGSSPCVPCSCEAHPLDFQVIPTVVHPKPYNSNHGLFSLKVKSRLGTHWISLSFCIFYQVHLGHWQKVILETGLVFPKGRTTHAAFLSHFCMCTVGSFICSHSVWALCLGSCLGWVSPPVAWGFTPEHLNLQFVELKLKKEGIIIPFSGICL